MLDKCMFANVTEMTFSITALILVSVTCPKLAFSLDLLPKSFCVHEYQECENIT